MENFELYLKQLKEFFWKNNINPDISQIERLSLYASLLYDKNKILNLVSRKDIDNIVENHIFICSYINHFIPKHCKSFLDIGTGGGLPGIPLAISNPFLKGILADSTSKKIAAVQEFIHKLKLSNIKAESIRVEDPEFITKHQNSFDLVVSRATVPLIMLIRYSLPLVKDKAFLLSLKGGDLSDEIKVAEIKYKINIKKYTVFELSYKPNNLRNEKEKKLILLELIK
ncbi:MAG: 16S rRNA (guanine(527)-N(7))-methyltransferase RsmG [Ignavibacteria bacterium]|nr:16S rRNA (guanine(527)-N(7))-methyltransferase RsmG [Ignavibacteria bacterium]